MHVTDGKVDRTCSVPNSALRLSVDKVQGLRSGTLTITCCVLHSENVETRVKSFYLDDLELF